MFARTSVTLLALGLLVCGCSKKDSSGAAADGTAPPATTSTAAASMAKAEVGKPAPDFSLKSLDGNMVSLSEHKGKIVVLEWFNPDCPFVKDAHVNGSLKGMAARFRDKDVVWLAINSAASGRQGHGAKANTEGKARFGIDYPILFDEDGRVGHAYGAERTPQMYVIDRAGTLVYRGALDTTRGDAEDGENVEYFLADAIADVAAGKPVTRADTKPWGCSVKYATR